MKGRCEMDWTGAILFLCILFVLIDDASCRGTYDGKPFNLTFVNP